MHTNTTAFPAQSTNSFIPSIPHLLERGLVLLLPLLPQVPLQPLVRALQVVLFLRAFVVVVFVAEIDRAVVSVVMMLLGGDECAWGLELLVLWCWVEGRARLAGASVGTLVVMMLRWA